MRRSFVVVLSVFALTLVSACGDGEEATSSNPATTAPGGAGHDDHGESSPVVEGARRIDVNATSFSFGPDEIVVHRCSSGLLGCSVAMIRMWDQVFRGWRQGGPGMRGRDPSR